MGCQGVFGGVGCNFLGSVAAQVELRSGRVSVPAANVRVISSPGARVPSWESVTPDTASESGEPCCSAAIDIESRT